MAKPPGLLLPTILFSVVFLAGTTVLWQEQGLGLPNIEGEQLKRHLDVLAGHAPDPWRYRVLAAWVSAGFIKFAEVFQVSRPVVVGFLSLRLLQNAVIFTLAYAYYRRLGMDARRALVGIMVLGAAFTYANYNSDLSVSTYFDLMFYLGAALSVLSGTQWWPFLVIVAVAAVNRETSGLIPLLPLSTWLARPSALPRDWRRLAWLVPLALAIWFAIFVGVRAYVGLPPSNWREQWGFVRGLPTVVMNLSSHVTLMYLAATFSILPLLTLLGFRSLPDFIRGLFWLMVPLWVVLHVSMVVANETRIFLVPIGLVLIPGALYRRQSEQDSPPRHDET